jgi:hypothetical protein
VPEDLEWLLFPCLLPQIVKSALAIAETPFRTGFRVHKQLRALVQAHALYRGDTRVKIEDFEEIRRLSKFMNLDFHQI